MPASSWTSGGFRDVRIVDVGTGAVFDVTHDRAQDLEPSWTPDGRYLLFSDIPNNRILRWDETSGALSEFRKPSNNANGHGRDRQGRLISCEHLTRRVTRTEYDGKITVRSRPGDGSCFRIELPL